MFDDVWADPRFAAVREHMMGPPEKQSISGHVLRSKAARIG